MVVLLLALSGGAAGTTTAVLSEQAFDATSYDDNNPAGHAARPRGDGRDDDVALGAPVGQYGRWVAVVLGRDRDRSEMRSLTAFAPRRPLVVADAINIPLSQARAQSVAAALAAARPDLVLTVAGHGSANEVAPNLIEGADSPVGRAQNRRVELTYPTT